MTTLGSTRRGTIPNFKIVIYSVHHDPWKYPEGYEARYQAALAFVNAAEPTAQGGLSRAYYTRAGERLTTLEEVVRALLAGELQ